MTGVTTGVATEIEARAARMASAVNLFESLFSLYATLSCVADLRFEIRCMNGKGREPKGKPPREWFTLDTDGCMEGARHALEAGEHFDTYIGVLPRIGQSGTSEDIVAGAALWASLDNNDAGIDGSVALLKAAKLAGGEPVPPPHVVIASGGGLHCAWLLPDAYDLASGDARRRFSATAGRLHKAIGGDAPGAAAESKASYLSYMLRVPGSYNHKAAYGKPRLVRFMRFAPDAERKPLVWWRANLPPEPIPESFRRTYAPSRYGNSDRYGIEREKNMPAAALAIINTPAPPATRHDTAVKLCAILAASKWGWDTIAVVLQSFANQNAWRLEKNELEKIQSYFERKQPSHA